MAAIGKSRPVKRVSPIKPGLRGARNWATAQIRAASYSRKGFWRLCLTILALFFMIIFGALWLGGFLPDARQASGNFAKDRLMSMGFVVDRIDVMGEGRLRESDVRSALGVREGDFLFAMDIEAAQNRIEAISWVDRAVVRRLWPDRIVVQIIERKPYALWQNAGEVKLVDYEGELLGDADVARFSYLRLIVGPNAPEHVSDLETLIRRFPSISERSKSFVQMPSGRWNIHMNDGGPKILLPVEGADRALAKLTEIHRASGILDRDVSIIDLRLRDRITVTPGTAEHA